MNGRSQLNPRRRGLDIAPVQAQLPDTEVRKLLWLFVDHVGVDRVLDTVGGYVGFGVNSDVSRRPTA
jgi:hypothetical protein